MTIKLYVIAAACENMGIGYKNDLPWRLRKEMAYFNRLTRKTEDPDSGKINAVVMGRRTWDSIPAKFRPLPERLNVVLSSNTRALEVAEKDEKNAVLYSNWDDAIQSLNDGKSSALENIDKVWVVGGCSVYKMALESPLCHRLYLTRILQNFECDTFFPDFDKSKFQLVTDPDVPQEEQEENGIKYKFEVYEKIN